MKEFSPAPADSPVIDSLKGRRSTPRVRAERPPRALVQRVLEAAAWAPNHYRTEPWRFFVVAGKAREDLGAILMDSLRVRLGDEESAESRAALEKERLKPLRAPVIVAVAVVPSSLPKVEETEEIAATAAAVQNMLLAAEALGLGAMWRTGAPARDPAVKRFLGLSENAHILAFVYLGYPDAPVEHVRVRGADKYTTWFGWDVETD